MEVVTTAVAFREHLDAVRALGRTVGLVPTMGALHDGHLSLASAAAGDCDVVAMTIFVNPLQFAADEDLDAYPRPIERDLELAESVGVDVVFTPSVAEMYPGPVLTTVHVAELTTSMEGATRPTHFDGVTTVVAKLFNLAGPCRAYFGEKDFQQLAVVRRMVADLAFPVTVVGCPIVREADGLAMSSRNRYLDPRERERAAAFPAALRQAAAQDDPQKIVGTAMELIAQTTGSVPEYVAVVDTETLEPVAALDRPAALAAAVKIGETRLIDNVRVGPTNAKL